MIAQIVFFLSIKDMLQCNEALLAHPWLEPKAESQGLFRAKYEKSNVICTEQQKHTTFITLDNQCQVTKAEMI